MVTKKTTIKKPATTKVTVKKSPPKPRKTKADVEVSPASLNAPVYNAKGKEVRTIELPELIFDVRGNDTLVHQVVVGMEANSRASIAHTKDRGEVRGGGRKPWKQKGTGRARHGSRRSPIWRGGGVTHGPRNEKDYSKRINKKMRVKALAIVLSQKFRDGEIIFVDALSMKEPKTKEAKTFIGTLGGIKGFESLKTRKKNAALLVLGVHDANLKKSFRNMGNVLVEESRNLNPVEALSFRYVVFVNPEAALEEFTKRMK